MEHSLANQNFSKLRKLKGFWKLSKCGIKQFYGISTLSKVETEFQNCGVKNLFGIEMFEFTQNQKCGIYSRFFF